MDVSDYCNICGAKVIRKRLSIKNLFAHINEEFIGFDNKFIVTCKDLIRRPEAVINGYVSSIRKKYINPISFFAISLSISGLYIFILRKFFPNALDYSEIYTEETTQKMSETISDLILDYNSLFYFAIVPLLAIISRIVFYNKKYNYTEHVVIYLYSMSLSAVITSILSLLILITYATLPFEISLGFNAIMILYHGFLLKRIFNLTWTQLLLKSLLFIVVFGIGYFIFSILMVLVLVTFTDLNLQDFVPPENS